MRLNSLKYLFVSLILLFALWPMATLAQDVAVESVEIQIVVDRTTLNTNETVQVVLVLRNTTPHTLTDVNVQPQQTTFNVVETQTLPDTLSPYASAQAKYTLKSQKDGSQNAVFIVQYSWDEPDTGRTYQQAEAVSIEGIEVVSPSGFNWPDYLIPTLTLLIGFVTGQVGSWVVDLRRQRKEEKERRDQVRGVTLAILQAARKGVQEREKISFGLWEEAIVKGHLYPALHQLGREIGKPELSKRLAELSITMDDYNERLGKKSLTQEMTDSLTDELTDLITILENVTWGEVLWV